ncbi:MAG: hypothetical protein JWL63_790 [Rhodocyclales bacterium]|nr:hypothetical protein [Rhodocyclales bacterium]
MPQADSFIAIFLIALLCIFMAIAKAVNFAVKKKRFNGALIFLVAISILAIAAPLAIFLKNGKIVGDQILSLVTVLIIPIILSAYFSDKFKPKVASTEAPTINPENREKAARQLGSLLKPLNAAFCIAYAALALYFFLVIGGKENVVQTNALTTVISWLAIIAFVALYTLIGVQAVRIQKSPILWVGGSVITTPIGPIFSFFWIRSETKAACHRLIHPKEEMNKVGAEGSLACEENQPKSSNPYRYPNTETENLRFADYWDRGYAVAARSKKSA